MISDEEYRRIRWSSRRGMLELDVLLLPFVEHQFPGLTAEQQALYRELLEHDDAQLMDWLGRGEAPEDRRMAELVGLIRGAHGEK